MICGLVSLKSVGLINREHINQLLKKFKLVSNDLFLYYLPVFEVKTMKC